MNYALNPEVDGHLVVQPAWHVKSISDLRQGQAGVLGMLIRSYCFALQQALNPDKIYVYSFNEDIDYHLHVHLKPKPRKAKDITEAEFVKWKDEEMRKGQKEIESLMNEVRAEKKSFHRRYVQ